MAPPAEDVTSEDISMVFSDVVGFGLLAVLLKWSVPMLAARWVMSMVVGVFPRRADSFGINCCCTVELKVRLLASSTGSSVENVPLVMLLARSLGTSIVAAFQFGF